MGAELSAFQYQAGHLNRSETFWHVKSYGKKFLKYLFDIAHPKWFYHNAHIHVHQLQGLSGLNYVQIMDKVRNTKIYFLEQDCVRLGECSSVHMQYWLAQMASVLMQQPQFGLATKRDQTA